MRVYINPGHDIDYDSGAVNPDSGLRECDVALKIGKVVKGYLEAAGCECRLLQSDNLCYDSSYEDRPVAVCADANNWPADVFVSIHCNAANGCARGTEVEQRREPRAVHPGPDCQRTGHRGPRRQRDAGTHRTAPYRYAGRTRRDSIY